MHRVALRGFTSRAQNDGWSFIFDKRGYLTSKSGSKISFMEIADNEVVTLFFESAEALRVF